MAHTQPPRVDNEIVQMWRRDGRLYAIAGFIAGVMLFPLLASLSENLAGFLQELAPEAVGILVTVFLIDRIIRRRDERNAEAALKRQLLIDAASQSNEKAKDAVHQLKNKQWLIGKDGLLKGTNLVAAHLEGSDLFAANLEGTYLDGVHLQDAKLIFSYLKGARLVAGKLERAYFMMANLKGANLMAAHLNGTNFAEANLEGVDLQHAKFDGKTVLPDGHFWTKETDISRFTNPSHSDFWRSNDPKSPAYQGNDNNPDWWLPDFPKFIKS